MLDRQISVKPSDWQDAPVAEKFVLSDMDHTMPKIYVQIVEVFRLSYDLIPGNIVENLKKGLEFALRQFPILTGSLHMDANTGRLWVMKKQDSAVLLHVKDISDDFPSLADLDARDFPVQLMDGNRLLPSSVTEKQLFSPLGDNAEDDTIVSTFQINFIRGGLILAAAIHHSCSDGPGCNGFLTTWAEASAAATIGAPFKPIDKANLNRDRLSAVKPTPNRWKELDGKFVILQDMGGPSPPPPEGFTMPLLKIRMWHFPRSSAVKLKEDSTASAASEEAWISTYDAIMALLWKTITRAKIDLLNPNLEEKAVLVHAVNTRNILKPPLPTRYLGNAVALPRVEPLRLEEILADENLPRLASAVRQSIKAITPAYVAELPEWVAGLEDRRWININMKSFMGMDLAGTSWQAMTPYETHDFGFGLPKALRWPHPQFEGYVFVLPSRAAVKQDSLDEGIEVCVCLEESCHDRLLQDPELLKYAHPR